ncbi:helix-hairpin-helix domain-containing protein [Austwickia chelonae]|uniref:helix-hairpin-helix domain-containing protein n=1 Tax=Austwickia chelonae TaxID=100225 RepID=UPI001F076CB3|nr:helix-hairpin-helix domain-containing protein [Austwickia chelonae]
MAGGSTVPGPGEERTVTRSGSRVRLLTLPPMLQSSRVRPAWGAIGGLAVLGVLVAVVFGVRVFMTSSAATPTPVVASNRPGDLRQQQKSIPEGKQSAASPVTTPTSTGSTAGTLVVHVVGQVKKPGVVRAASGARVEEVIAASGGLTAQADTRQVNLARVVSDGEQVVVPAHGELLPPGQGGGASGGPGGKSSAAPGKINVNTADATALDALPGVGPVTARRIVEWRQSHGRFSSLKELQEIPGIGPKLVEQIMPLVSL